MCINSDLEVLDRQGWSLNMLTFKALFVDHDKLGYLFHCLKNKTT